MPACACAVVVRVIDAFVDRLDLSELGFERTIAAASGPATCCDLYLELS
jgi:hypothetical protein